MRILVLSDSHIQTKEVNLPQQVIKEARSCDLILHAGDLTNLSVVEKLKEFAPVKAVFGNMDPEAVRKNLPAKEIIKLGKFKIGLIHGEGPPDQLVEYVRSAFDEKEKLDCIVFGHTHSPINEKVNNILMFNPGTVADKIFASYNSYGILELNDEIKAQIKRID